MKLVFIMKRIYINTAVSIMTILFVFGCSDKQENKQLATGHTPDSLGLYDSIVYMDSVLFAAYNNCDLEKFASLVSEDLEFYHDKGGLMTSKDSLILALKNNICGKVTRELVGGSIEVYPIAGYGAVEMGQHIFHNSQEPEPVEHKIGKFVQLWKHENGSWYLTRVISLH